MRVRLPHRFLDRSRERGVSMIELMIGVTVGLIAALAIAQVFSTSESHRRATTGAADSQQIGTLASWRLMRELRVAGSSLQHGSALWGCPLRVWRNGAVVLPRATPWPAPFAAWPLDLPLVPIAALPGGATGPDQILVMAGRTSAGPAPQPVSVVSPTLVNVPSSVGFNPNDFLLVADAGDVRPCRMGQVAPSYAAMPGFPAPSAVPTGAVATGYNGPSGFAGLPGGRDYVLFNLGAAPSIQMLGVRDNQLLQYDVLQFGGVSDPVVVAENVETMVVLYGVDDGVGAGVANDNVVDGWVRVGTAPYTAAAMLAGGETTLRVKAIRVAIVLRSAEASVHEGPGSLVLFEDLPAPLRVTLSYTGAERSFARQVYDVVIPLRNQAVALCSEMRRAMGMPATGACG